MPCEKELTKLIPRIYKWNVENIGLFFFVKAQLQVFPTLKLQQGFNNYRKFAGITIDEWDDESMRATFTKLQNEFYETAKTDK